MVHRRTSLVSTNRWLLSTPCCSVDLQAVGVLAGQEASNDNETRIWEYTGSCMDSLDPNGVRNARRCCHRIGVASTLWFRGEVSIDICGDTVEQRLEDGHRWSARPRRICARRLSCLVSTRALLDRTDVESECKRVLCVLAIRLEEIPYACPVQARADASLFYQVVSIHPPPAASVVHTSSYTLRGMIEHAQ